MKDRFEGKVRVRGFLVAALLAALFLAPSCSGAMAGQRADVLLDVPYAEPAHAEQYLDFHWPGGSPPATVLFIHGGSLSESGERRDAEAYRRVCPRLADAGFGCATVDYRLAPSFQWPTMPLDVAASLVKVRELVAERGGDPDRIVLFGHSSGCHLAAILGANPEYLAAVGLSTDDLAGVIPMGCVLDIYDAAFRGVTVEQIREPFAASDDVETFGTADQWIAAQPSFHIGPHMPRTLVIVAEQERFAPPILEQGARFVRRLRDFDVDADLIVVPGRHMTSIADFGDPDDPTFAAVVDFLTRS